MSESDEADLRKEQAGVLVDEYKRIQQEIYQKIELSFRVSNMQIALAGALMPILGAVWGADSKGEVAIAGLTLGPVLLMMGALAFGLVFAMLGLTLSNIHAHLYSAAAYAHRHIRPRLHSLLKDPHLLEWEPFIYRRRIDANFRHTNALEWITLLAPVVIAVSVGWQMAVRDFGDRIDLVVVLGAWTVLVMSLAGRAYLQRRQVEDLRMKIVFEPERESRYVTTVLNANSAEEVVLAASAALPSSTPNDLVAALQRSAAQVEQGGEPMPGTAAMPGEQPPAPHHPFIEKVS